VEIIYNKGDIKLESHATFKSVVIFFPVTDDNAIPKYNTRNPITTENARFFAALCPFKPIHTYMRMISMKLIIPITYVIIRNTSYGKNKVRIAVINGGIERNPFVRNMNDSIP
jgi:hypothetical protein